MTRSTFLALLALPLLMLPVALPAAGQTLKIATISPEGSYWMTRMREGAAEIQQRTDGRVQLKFYGGGVMGNDKKVLRKMRVGQLHGGTFTSGGLVEQDPDLQLYGLPLLFNSADEVAYVRKRMDEILLKGLEQKSGLVSFGLASGGFARLMSNSPVRSLDDLRGRKIWVPEGDAISYAAMEALGLAPVTLPITDVLTGLQTGLIEIIGSSAVGAVVLQWHTKVSYISDLPVTYIYALLAIDGRAFGRLDPADQQAVREVMEATYREFDAVNDRDDAQANEALAKAGIETVPVEQDQLPQWRRLVGAVNQKQADDGMISPALLATLQQHLADFRTQQQAAATAP
ncbi:MAG: TRAP transporter substrate-binding protein DctP [Gammaproteobacteria bacterium]|nr:TRAP transporter substrate-binding protein DctP [Gammaproteobacteria bacterium]NNF61766.1 TRAP transporter substrate-binding protein DctP [Gammaproteobacteria bacterium]NNM20431.1 TRAP transporter substrate-binding protein DctP [Gammaproteobacteria bacterium]